jgi:hypothetical protein
MRRSLLATVVAATAVALAPPVARADETGDQLRGLVDKVAPSVVTLRVVVSVSFGGGSAREQRGELQGVIIDKSGLILCSEGPFGNPSRGGFEVKVNVTDLKIVLENEEKEYEGFLVANDSKLHVAFVQLEGLEDRALVPVDLENAATPDVGEPVVTVSRMGKGFDYAPYFEQARLSGKIRKPRKAWIYHGETTQGLPCFTMDGKVVGVPSAVESGMEEQGFGRGGTFILPARTIRASVQQAQKQVVELIKTRAEEKAKAAAAGDAKKDGEDGKTDPAPGDEPKKEGGE